MNEINVSDVLKELRQLSKQSGLDGFENSMPIGDATERAGFTDLLKQSLNEVNDVQKSASELATAFESGDPNVELSSVMIEMQKARISFEALNQVRNKLISAYQEVMNMQV
ncbi:MAG: flagellar hook-basal body complex protein FliE [Gammaproteobacteria bacterium]|nr:flagellar hook-basal body complex protein FliE [Gammaproteobacteria bacterium]